MLIWNHWKAGCTQLFLLLAVVGVLSLRSTGAQTIYGSIYGTVLDKNGALVTNAAVVVQSQQKDTSFSAQTNALGQFRIDHLVPDTYNVTIKAPGFKTLTVDGLQVNAGDSPRVDAQLAVGTVSESVTVNANAEELLKTERQDVSLSVQQETIQGLPLVSQEAANMILLYPGAYAMLGQNGVQALNPAGGSSYTLSGQPVGGVNYTLDGTDNTGPILGYIIVNPAPETIQEAKIITSSFDAETGRSTSAVLAMQTKSGGNAFHGGIADLRTSSANLARDPYSGAETVSGPAPALMNQFDLHIGGPILKQRLFSFFDYFGQRQKVGTSVQTTLPTNHLRNTCLGMEATSTGVAGCDFGEYDQPSTGGPAATIYQPDGTPYPNNILPAALLSTQALNLLKMLPPPTVTSSSDPNFVNNNFSAHSTGTTNTGQYTTRVDNQLSTAMHLFGRWTLYRDDLHGKPVFGAAGGSTGLGEAGHGTGSTHSVALGLDDALTDKLLMDVRIGYYEDHLTDDMYNANVNLGTQLGIPGINGTGAPLSNGMPGFSITGSAGTGSITAGTTGSTPYRQREDQFQLTNNWTRILGTHSVKVGADLRYGRENRQESFDSRTGTMAFGTGPTSLNTNGGLGLATFMLGEVTGFNRDVSQAGFPKENQKRTFLYAQDTWRATRKLTVNLGLRWEIYFPENVGKAQDGALMNLATGKLQVAGVGGFGMNMGQSAPYTNFGPRLGFSYQLGGKTVASAGYARSFAEANYGSIFGQVPVENPPVYGHQNLNPSSPTGSVFNLSQGPPAFVFPTVPSSGLLDLPSGVSPVVRVMPTLRIPTLDSWNARVQRAITSTLTATVGYVGNKGTHTYAGNWMYTFPNAPQPILPGSESITGQTVYYDPSASSAIDVNGHTSNIFNLQPLYAKFGWQQQVSYDCMCGDTHFHALQLTLDKRFSHGLSMTGNYAYQHARNYDSAYLLVDKKVTYGPPDTGFAQVATVFGFYQLPFGRHGDFARNVPSWVDALIGGYQLSPSINLSSGQPFSASYTQCASNLPQIPPVAAANSAPPCYPNQNGHFPMKLTKLDPIGHTRNYFTPVPMLTAANPVSGVWSMPSLDQIGNFKRNSLTGPGAWNVDFSATKTVTIHEGIAARFRMDAFNAFNHINASVPAPFYTQFGLPVFVDNPYIGGKIFNRAFGTSPRQLDFALKIQF